MDSKDFPSAISSPYSPGEANAPIPIYKGQVEIGTTPNNISAEGSVQFRWLPSPRIDFEFFTSTFERYHMGDKVECRLSPDFDPVTLYISGENMSWGDSGSRRLLSGEVLGTFFKGTQAPVSRVIFHIPNFLKTQGSHAVWFENGNPVYSTGRMNLETEEWRITIDDVTERSKTYATLKSSRGYAITHLGEVSRVDGRDFTFDEIDVLHEELSLFLSWTRGTWISPFLYVGYTSDEKELWTCWKAPSVDRWRVVNHWFPDHDTSNIQESWASFRGQISDPVWGDVLRRALDLYLVCNRFEGGAEGGIIMAQTALEMISWNRFVTEKGLTPSGFEKLPASDRLRLPLQEARIPTSIPSNLVQLLDAAQSKAFNWVDGPHATTEIRNMIVHPTPSKLSKLRKLTADEIYQGYMLSMWYLELTMLYYSNYEGHYYDRSKFEIHYGDTNTVPWS